MTHKLSIFRVDECTREARVWGNKRVHTGVHTPEGDSRREVWTQDTRGSLRS